MNKEIGEIIIVVSIDKKITVKNDKNADFLSAKKIYSPDSDPGDMQDNYYVVESGGSYKLIRNSLEFNRAVQARQILYYFIKDKFTEYFDESSVDILNQAFNSIDKKTPIIASSVTPPSFWKVVFCCISCCEKNEQSMEKKPLMAVRNQK